MKLLVKTSLYYLLFSVPTLILSGFICYYLITNEVKQNSDEVLKNRGTEIENHLKNNDTIILNLINKSGEAIIKKTDLNHYSNGSQTLFSDTLILDKIEKEYNENRMISSIIKIKDQNYQIKIWRSTLEYNELIESIFYILLLILFFLFLITLLINFWVSKTLWRPFYATVNSLKTFRASTNKIPSFENSSVLEFNELNFSLRAMMDKMIVDYNSQKKFTENASHEIQTPLAVIKSKIDLLIQSNSLAEKDMKLIMAIEESCSKLVSLNKSLLMLTKIENRQFNELELVSFEDLFQTAFLFFQDHIEASNLKITTIIEADFAVKMNPDLGRILVNNLLQNAIRHTHPEGEIALLLQKNQILITNTGSDSPIDPNLFERFQKNSTSKSSLGLGLSIIKEIVEGNNLILNYSFKDNKHCFTILNKKN